MPRRTSTALAVAALLAVPLLAGCGLKDDGKPQVIASFYPLQFVAQRIVGDHADVTDLTGPGLEPHDIELSAPQVLKISVADVGIYEHGLAPSVDAAMKNDPPKVTFDIRSVVKLVDAPAGESEHAGGNADPHFWQDPTLLATVADAFTRTMSKAEPRYAADFRANNARLQEDLTRLDADFKAGLANCKSRTLVVSHDAFEYLGRRYHLKIDPIAGLSPDAEPSPRHLQQLSDLIRTDHITTVFTETLASPKMAQTLAGDLHIGTAVLDPLEGLTKASQGRDYLSVMRANLKAIQKADSCS